MKNETTTVDGDVRCLENAKPYSPPALRDFGPVSMLTQAGTAGLAEMATSMMGPNPNRMA